MPTVAVQKDQFFQALGKTFTEDELEKIFFQFGLELDETVTEPDEDGKEVEVYKIEVAANRYDLLCVEGITRALRVFLGIDAKPPVFTCNKPDVQEKIVASTAVTQIRPFVVAAVLRGVSFTAENYAHFIDLQDKLHQNICRRRTLVAIGTHDLDTIQGPFRYEALPPKEISFIPLKQTREFNAEELMEFYESDAHLKPYLPIIRDSPVYPVIYDANNVVLSLPPIINGEHSKITLDTKNVFIECTATDMTKARIVVNMMVTMFSEYCAAPFTVEQVEVVGADGNAFQSPQLSSVDIEVDADHINRRVGIQVSPAEQVELLKKMMLEPRVADNGKIAITVPPTRPDILHACDIVEDVAIAYGYDNIVKTIPATNTIAHQQPLNKLSDQLRHELAQAGYYEVLTFGLCSHEENFDHLRLEDDGNTAVTIANPKTFEFQECRASLLPGMLKTLSHNRDHVLPVKLFEVSDIVRKDDTKDVGARNERRLIAAYMGMRSPFQDIHGLVDTVMRKLKAFGEYKIVPSQVPTFFPGRCVDIVYKGVTVGHFGDLHPEVLATVGLQNVVSVVEMNLEPFV